MASPSRLRHAPLFRVGLLVCLALVACSGVRAPAPPSSRPEPRAGRARLLGLDLYVPAPADNPTRSETVALGRRLFRERLLSRDRSLSCADCHQPERAFTDGRSQSVGVRGRPGPRNVSTLVNRAWGRAFSWDGRHPSLEVQVLRPIEHHLEMDLALDEAVARLGRAESYPRAFRDTFGRGVNREDLGRALAAYVRTIRAGESPYDRYSWGQREALSPEALAGLELFRGKANCTACHTGPYLTDEGFHNTGVAWSQSPRDPGRGGVTGLAADARRFKTPTLREVARTAPYMHDGSLRTLEEVVDYYDRGGNPDPLRARELRPLALADGEKAALRAFLESLSGRVVEGDVR